MVNGGSVVIASLVAIYGINQWRREYRGKRQAELAEEVLSLFYEARDAVSYIRNPFSFGGEGESRKPGRDESPEDKKAYDQAYVAFERLDCKIDVFNKIQSIRYRFMAIFGVDAAQPFDELREIISRIQVAAKMLGKMWARRDKNMISERDWQDFEKRLDEYEGIFWEGLLDEDPISLKLDKCIIDIERICRDALISRESLFCKCKRK